MLDWKFKQGRVDDGSGFPECMEHASDNATKTRW